MQTVCPHCQTTFRIRANQLSAKDGWVRCGVCNETFQSLVELSDPPSPDSAIHSQDSKETKSAKNKKHHKPATKAPNSSSFSLNKNKQEDEQTDNETKKTLQKKSSIGFIDESAKPKPVAENLVSTPTRTRAKTRAKTTDVINLAPEAGNKALAWHWIVLSIFAVTLITQTLLLVTSKKKAPLTLSNVTLKRVDNNAELAKIAFTLTNATKDETLIPPIALTFKNNETQIFSVMDYSNLTKLPSGQALTHTIWIKRTAKNTFSSTPSSWMPIKIKTIE